MVEAERDVTDEDSPSSSSLSLSLSSESESESDSEEDDEADELGLLMVNIADRRAVVVEVDAANVISRAFSRVAN